MLIDLFSLIIGLMVGGFIGFVVFALVAVVKDER